VKNTLLVTRTFSSRSLRRAALVVGLGAAVLALLTSAAPARAANLLSNPGFDFVGPVGPTTSFTGVAASLSAAANWTIFHNLPGTTRTQLLPAPWGGKLIHVYTSALGDGLVQVFLPFNTGPHVVNAAARIYVVHGKVGIGTGNGGNTHIDAVSATTGQWEVVHAPNGVSPANEFIIYAVSPGGAEFFVDAATVWP